MLLAQEPEWLAAVVVDCVVVSLALAGAPVPWPLVAPGSVLLAVWLLLMCVHAVLIERWRVQSRSAGFTSVVVVPENPWLLRRLLRRSGHAAPWRPYAVAVHVNERWRPPPGLTPGEAAEEFGWQYRADYDRLLEDLAGQAVLVISSTFNRHESEWTRRAAAEGWCRVSDRPLFRSAPGRNGPRSRARVQRQMFGGVVSRRRVDRPEAWRTRVFDCLRYRLVRARPNSLTVARAARTEPRCPSGGGE